MTEARDATEARDVSERGAAGVALPPSPPRGPIDRAIGILEDAATAVGLAGRCIAAARELLRGDPVRRMAEDAAERARAARPPRGGG